MTVSKSERRADYQESESYQQKINREAQEGLDMLEGVMVVDEFVLKRVTKGSFWWADSYRGGPVPEALANQKWTSFVECKDAVLRWLANNNQEEKGV